MGSRRPVSASKNHGGDMYDVRSSYLKSKELLVSSDEDDLHDSLSDKGLVALQFPCHRNVTECSIH